MACRTRIFACPCQTRDTPVQGHVRVFQLICFLDGVLCIIICVEMSSGCVIEGLVLLCNLSSCECGLVRFMLVMRFKGLLI